MNNICLVTTLEGVADNSDLKVFDIFKVVLNTISTVNRLTIETSAASKIELVGTGNFCSSDGSTVIGKTVNTETGRNEIYFKDAVEDDILIVHSKSKVVEITSGYNTNQGYIKALRDIEYMNQMAIFNTGNRMTFNFDLAYALESMPNITQFINNYNTELYGSIETAVEKMIDKGRNTGSTTIMAYKSKITLNSVKVLEDKTQPLTISFNNGTASVSLNDSTLASYDGTNWTYA